MSTHLLGIFIGGLIPALLFAVTNLFAKVASNMTISPGLYVLFVGTGVCLVGGMIAFLSSELAFTLHAGLISVIVGVCWGLGISFVIIALKYYGSPISVLTPLFNMNTLITVFMALWIFAEWKNVKMPQLLIGSLCIVVGGILVSKA